MSVSMLRTSACDRLWACSHLSRRAMSTPICSSGKKLPPSFRFVLSSRRRHTISDRDWSSDVCSSDLQSVHRPPAGTRGGVIRLGGESLQRRSHSHRAPVATVDPGPRGHPAYRRLVSPKRKARALVPGIVSLLPCSRLRPATVRRMASGDRKSTRLNSSHDQISYAVFCLKKKR